MCGEYGEQGDRPHFHACLFNHQFEDRELFRITPTGNKLYTSKILDGLWTNKRKELKGWCTIGDVTFESAAYVARYIMKKVNGRNNNSQYDIIDIETGEIGQKEKEFNRMSLKPGIGSAWYDKYKKEVFPQDIVVMNGKEMKPPKYYYKKLHEENKEMQEEVAFERERRANKNRADNTDERLQVKEIVLREKLKQLVREVE